MTQPNPANTPSANIPSNSLNSQEPVTDNDIKQQPAIINQPEKLIDAEYIKKCLAHADDIPMVWVDDFEGLEACLDDLETRDRIALDTEFLKRSTYYPKLALIQINTGDTIYLIDAPELDLTQFWIVLYEMPLMIWHACGEDLSILYLLSDSPALDNVVDTQIALAYLTGNLQIGYQQALATQLDVHIEKGESRSNWLVRPLRKTQIKYAIDDVRYLLCLNDILDQQLQIKNMVDKVREDCTLYAKEIFDTAYIEDDAVYLSMSDFRYTSKQMAVLQAVSSWREALARALNQPRTFILKKQAVREIVQELPTNMKMLKYHTSIDRKIIHIYGKELLEVIHVALKLEEAELPARVYAPYRSKDKTLTKAVNNLIKEYHLQTEVPINVLMRKKWLSRLYEVVAYDLSVDDLPDGLLGWRREWVTTVLMPFLETHKQDLKLGMSREPYIPPDGISNSV